MLKTRTSATSRRAWERAKCGEGSTVLFKCKYSQLESRLLSDCLVKSSTLCTARSASL